MSGVPASTSIAPRGVHAPGASGAPGATGGLPASVPASSVHRRASRRWHPATADPCGRGHLQGCGESRGWFETFVVALAISALAGCTPGDRADLVVGTTWPEAARAEINRALAPPAGSPPRVAWVRLAPGRDPADLATHRAPVDLILGGPPSSYRRLDRDGSIGPWREVRSSISIRPPWPGDPRADPAALADAEARLSAGKTWSEGYAGLVRAAGRRHPHDSGAAVTHAEGVAIGPAATSPRAAGMFLKALGGGAPPADPGIDPLAEDLLADLLGATLVDARPELIAAVEALAMAGDAASAVAPKLTEPPPWPPASVAELVRKRRARGDDPAPWVDTLARQVVPEFEARAWLIVSWDRPERPIDAETLAELARAAGGGLAREPRFRAWLRGEWREWARQRYRRVARRASGGWP